MQRPGCPEACAEHSLLSSKPVGSVARTLTDGATPLRDVKGTTDGLLPCPGLFNESLPVFLRDQDAAAASGRLENCTYVHIDCDLYAGTSRPAELLVADARHARSALHMLWVDCVGRFTPRKNCGPRADTLHDAGAHDALTMLSDRFSPGAILMFDEVRCPALLTAQTKTRFILVLSHTLSTPCWSRRSQLLLRAACS